MFNTNTIQSFNRKEFLSTTPYPHGFYQQFLTDETFCSLHENWPNISLFTKDTGDKKPGGRRYHTRYNITYHKGNKEMVRLSQLPSVWQGFVNALYEEPYRSWATSLFGNCKYRLNWHMAQEGEDVSPHCDSSIKYGTHILYFNTSNDWKDEWGGSTLVLSGKTTDANDPELNQFENIIKSESITNNKSFLFKNGNGAWHAVDKLKCPTGYFRKVFNVCFTNR